MSVGFGVIGPKKRLSGLLREVTGGEISAWNAYLHKECSKPVPDPSVTGIALYELAAFNQPFEGRSPIFL